MSAYVVFGVHPVDSYFFSSMSHSSVYVVFGCSIRYMCEDSKNKDNTSYSNEEAKNRDNTSYSNEEAEVTSEIILL